MLVISEDGKQRAHTGRASRNPGETSNQQPHDVRGRLGSRDTEGGERTTSGRASLTQVTACRRAFPAASPRYRMPWVSNAAKDPYIKGQAIWRLDIKSQAKCSPKNMGRGRGRVVKRRQFGEASVGEAIRGAFNKGKLLSWL